MLFLRSKLLPCVDPLKYKRKSPAWDNAGPLEMPTENSNVFSSLKKGVRTVCSCFGEVSPCAFALWVCGGGGGGGGGGGELNIPLGCCLSGFQRHFVCSCEPSWNLASATDKYRDSQMASILANAGPCLSKQKECGTRRDLKPALLCTV